LSERSALCKTCCEALHAETGPENTTVSAASARFSSVSAVEQEFFSNFCMQFLFTVIVSMPGVCILTVVACSDDFIIIIFDIRFLLVLGYVYCMFIVYDK